MKKLEIMWKLVRVKLNNEDKLFIWENFKKHIFKQIKKWAESWFLRNKKMMVVGEWWTNILLFDL